MTLRNVAASLALLSLGALAAPIHAQPFDVMETSIGAVHAAFASGRLSCRSLVQKYLDRIAAYDKIAPALNSIQTLNPRALEIADSLDRVLQEGARRGARPGSGLGALHCVPVLLKDQIETRDMPTTFGSILFKDFVSARDATVVTRLKAAGAIILAKTTMGEFASRYVGSAFGIVRNAYDPLRNPSGSSGGSASAVAANFGLIGIGEDTGGSVRGPAAVSALVGLRPTLQLVSRFGMLPANPSQDTMGPMARTIRDAALLLDIMVGYDAADPITAYAVGETPKSYTERLAATALRGARIGVLRYQPDTSIHADDSAFVAVSAVFDAALRTLSAQGATVLDSLVLVDSMLLRGIGNDYETEAATDSYLREHKNAPVESFKDIMLSGTVVPWRARGMMNLVGKTTNDAGYLRVIQQREKLRLAILALMADKQLDAIVYPTFTVPPTLIADDVLTNARPKDGYGRGDNRGLSPAIGFPALTVPAGFTAGELPVGLEFLGRPFTEAQLFGYGYAFEQATLHRKPPSRLPALAR